MIAPTVPRIAFFLSVIALLAAPANAQERWADDGFLADYGKLQPIPGKRSSGTVSSTTFTLSMPAW